MRQRNGGGVRRPGKERIRLVKLGLVRLVRCVLASGVQLERTDAEEGRVGGEAFVVGVEDGGEFG
jgi:hypothetical protein